MDERGIALNRMPDMSTVGTVRFWLREEGWGVIDSPNTPGGCWAHCSHLWYEEVASDPSEVIEVSGGILEAFTGEMVDFEWEPVADQDGYTFRATTVRPSWTTRTSSA